MGEGKEPIFRYGETEIQYLKQRDPKLGAIIDQIGPIERTVDDDLFSAIVHHIVGQQISTKAQQTIWRRMREDLGEINAETILAAGTERLQGFGMTFKKVEYIEDCARKAASGELDLEQLPQCSDKEIIDQLVSLKGIGVWTAEMILLFCQRQIVKDFFIKFTKIYKKGARSTVWLLTPRLIDYIFPFSRSLQRYA
ncbi:DNA-3-methyladenine glycosylase family protein [Holdemania filiformis]|uniref:DNA-3-methyladenine glycosylase family protein n=1 Tax=Holdemania filiformis TaxID=61171 RepID=UPI00210C6679|nr:hypothetical protein [Holdemania filiformis]MCQ4953970.1 hypothetical protein [Holdemania filiformis]